MALIRSSFFYLTTVRESVTDIICSNACPALRSAFLTPRFPDPQRNLSRADYVDPAQPLEHTKPPAPPEPETREETTLKEQEAGATAQEEVAGGLESGLVNEKEAGSSEGAQKVSIDAQAQAAVQREEKLEAGALRGNFEEVRQKGP